MLICPSLYNPFITREVLKMVVEGVSKGCIIRQKVFVESLFGIAV